MRSLITATIVATSLIACGQQTGNSSSSVAAASGASDSLTWKATYMGAVDQGSVSLSSGASSVKIKNLPTGQKGLLIIELMSGSTLKYRGRVNSVEVGSQSASRRVNLEALAAGESSQIDAEAAKYCGGNRDVFNDNFFDNNNIDDRFDDRFNNRFGRFGNNGLLFDNGRSATPTPTPVPSPTPAVGTGGGVAPKGGGEITLELIAPK